MNKAVLHTAIDLLSRREHSIKELQQKLTIRDFLIEDISPVIEYLVNENYQSEDRFSESVFRSRVNKGYGWRYIKNELRQKGISDEIVQNLPTNHEIDWYLQAELAYNKRFGASQIKDQKDKAKRMRFMQARGFSIDEIMVLLNT